MINKINEFIFRISKYWYLVLRCGIGGVIVWFGASQLLDVGSWTGFVPQWALVFGFEPVTIVYLNGIFEVVAGSLVSLGVWTRISAFLLFLHLTAIIYELGFTAVAMRDVAMAAALLAIALYGDKREDMLKNL